MLRVEGRTLTYNYGFYTFRNCNLDGELSQWHSYHIFLFLFSSSLLSTAGKVYKVKNQITGYKFDLNRHKIKKVILTISLK